MVIGLKMLQIWRYFAKLYLFSDDSLITISFYLFLLYIISVYLFLTQVIMKIVMKLHMKLWPQNTTLLLEKMFLYSNTLVKYSYGKHYFLSKFRYVVSYAILNLLQWIQRDSFKYITLLSIPNFWIIPTDSASRIHPRNRVERKSFFYRSSESLSITSK